MIRGIHGLFYSSDPDATRAFFRDQVKLPGSDVGDGWWIFDLPEGDLGVHPIDHGGTPGAHDVSFYCDDIEGTVAELKGRGVEFTGPVEDHGYGLVTYFTAPGGVKVQLYEARYRKTTSRPAARKPARKAARRTGRKAGPSARKAKRPAARKAPARKGARKTPARRGARKATRAGGRRSRT